jgi:hypothetical protein
MTAANIVPYAKVTAERWTNLVKEVDAGHVWITGDCSRCGHRTSRRFGRIIVAGLIHAPDGPAPPESIICDCQQEHPNRPEELALNGCGAMWWGTRDDA